MQWTIPGTALTVTDQELPFAEDKIRSMFLGGGMVLSQVASVTGLEPYTIQNWVKRGFLSGPQQKKYSLRQLCRIININMLKSILPMEEICGLLEYVNGQLDDETDDLIDDSQLYFLFLRLASYYRKSRDYQNRDTCVSHFLESYTEPVPGARDRVAKVLQIMLTAWGAAGLRQQAMKMVSRLKENSENVRI